MILTKYFSQHADTDKYDNYAAYNMRDTGPFGELGCEHFGISAASLYGVSNNGACSQCRYADRAGTYGR